MRDLRKAGLGILKVALVVTIGLIMAVGTQASAAPITITNPSFEDDDVADGQFTNGLAAGWDTVGTVTGTQDFSTGQLPPAATDGEQHAAVSWPDKNGSISQLTSHTIAAGETYTLLVDVGEVNNFSGSQATIRLFGSTAGIGTALSNANGTAVLAIVPGSGSYALDQTVTYTALASGDPFEGQDLGVGLFVTSGIQVLFDNVRLDVVPEPTSLALLGLGGLCVWRRRRR